MKGIQQIWQSTRFRVNAQRRGPNVCVPGCASVLCVADSACSYEVGFAVIYSDLCFETDDDASDALVRKTSSCRARKSCCPRLTFG